jgi:hypothetical protein
MRGLETRQVRLLGRGRGLRRIWCSGRDIALAFGCGLTLRTCLAGVKVQQCLSDRLGDKPPHFPLAVEPHLALGRVDVHVHFRRWDFQE